MFTFPPPAIDSTAMYGPIIVTPNPLSHYVAPTVDYQLQSMQRITNWHHLAHFNFQGEGSRYVRTLTCHNTTERPLVKGTNVVFLYSPSVLFTPDNPFGSLFHLTHLWYTVIDIQGSVFYFDLVRQLYNGVPLNQLVGKLKSPYTGTYILFTPEQNATSSLAPAVNTNRPPITSSSSTPAAPLLPSSSTTTAVAPTNLSASTASVPASTRFAMRLPSTVFPLVSTPGVVVAPLQAISQSTPRTTQESPSDSDSDDSQVRRQVKVSTM